MKAILFDLDNTLYPYKPCHEEGLNKVISTITLEWNISSDEANRHYDRAREWVKNRLQNTAASHHRLLYTTKFCEFIGKNPIVYAKWLEDIYWNGYFLKMRLYDGAKKLLSDLQSSGILLGVVTDLTADIQYRKLNILNLEYYFQAIVTSEESGIEKPNPIIFELAMEKLDIKNPTSVIMVGDSYSKDILGAINLGMRAYWIKGDYEKASEMVIPFSDMDELRDLLKNYLK